MESFSNFCSIFLAVAWCSVASMPASAQELLHIDSTVVSSNRNGVEQLLQGNVAGLRVKNWSGAAGTQSTINLRGLSLDPTDESTMPFIMVNGVPLIASPSAITAINPLSYYSADQIERIEIIKTIDQLAAYGASAANGAINIILKEGRPAPLHVRASAFAGSNFMNGFDYRKDAFYGFNTTARRLVYKPAIIHAQRAIIDGGGEFGSYLFGVENHGDRGTIAGTGLSQQTLFLNAVYRISDRLDAQFYSNLTLANRAGRYAGEYDRQFALPVIADEEQFMDDKKNTAQFSSLRLAYKLAPELTVSSVAGISYEGAKRDLFIPSTVLDGSVTAQSIAIKRQLISVNTTLQYDRSLSDQWGLSMTLGNELRSTDNRTTSVGGSKGLEFGGSNFVKVVTGYNATQTDARSGHDREHLLSFYGLWKLTMNEDLAVNLTLRTDGSSLYGRKWGFYPAAGVRYNFANVLSLPLVATASVGKAGVLSRPEIYRGELAAYGDYFNRNELGIGQLYAAYNDAKSIDVFQVDGGLQYTIGNRITVSADYFAKRYSDFTYRRYLPNIHGTDYTFETGGELRLSGLEAAVGGDLIRNARFTWASNINFARYHNTVGQLPVQPERTSLAHLAALRPGDAITSIIANEQGTAKVIGNSEARFFGGVNNTFRYAGVTVGFSFAYALGADVAAESFDSRYFADQVGGVFPIKAAETPYYFVQDGGSGTPVYRGIRTIEDGSFLRLSRAVIAYDVGPLLGKRLPLTRAEWFVRGDNLFTLTRYSGFNPEENVTGVRRADLSLTGMPIASSIALGLRLEF